MVRRSVFDVLLAIKVRMLWPPADEPRRSLRMQGLTRKERFSRGRK